MKAIYRAFTEDPPEGSPTSPAEAIATVLAALVLAAAFASFVFLIIVLVT